MDIAHLCNATITIMRRTSVSSAGDPTFSTSSAKANVRRHSQIVPLANGESVTATHELYSTSEILLGDRIVLPGFSGQDQSSPVLSVEPSVIFSDTVKFYRVML